MELSHGGKPALVVLSWGSNAAWGKFIGMGEWVYVVFMRRVGDCVLVVDEA